jgi:hypothetical protein
MPGGGGPQVPSQPRNSLARARGAAEPYVARMKNFAHPTAAERADNFVTTDDFTFRRPCGEIAAQAHRSFNIQRRVPRPPVADVSNRESEILQKVRHRYLSQTNFPR